ncbi:MAG: stage III sporulation protein AF [Clostridia bacterium]|nr:stage III sporulation protein AF [Clostridia bacterium]
MLYSIVSPVITKLTGNSLKVSDILDLNQYLEASSKPNSSYTNLENTNTNQIREVYITSLKNDMKEKITSKGYQVEKLEVAVENNEEYTIKSISLTVRKAKQEQKEEVQNKVNQIQAVNITIGNEQVNTTKNEGKESNTQHVLSQKEKTELQEYLSDVYELEKQNIVINE